MIEKLVNLTGTSIYLRLPGAIEPLVIPPHGPAARVVPAPNEPRMKDVRIPGVEEVNTIKVPFIPEARCDGVEGLPDWDVPSTDSTIYVVTEEVAKCCGDRTDVVTAHPMIGHCYGFRWI